MPGETGVTVVTMLVCFTYHLHARLRVHRAPGIPCALYDRGTLSCKARAHRAAGMRRCTWNTNAPHSRSSSPGVTGRSSIPRRQWWNRKAAAYWIPRRSLALGSPNARPGGRVW